MPIVKQAFGFSLDSTNATNPDMILSVYEVRQLKNAFEIFINGDASDEDASPLYGGYNPVAITCTHILSKKAGFGWTVYSHTGVPVATYALGNGQELFAGHYDNTDIAKKIFSLLK